MLRAVFGVLCACLRESVCVYWNIRRCCCVQPELFWQSHFHGGSCSSFDCRSPDYFADFASKCPRLSARLWEGICCSFFINVWACWMHAHLDLTLWLYIHWLSVAKCVLSITSITFSANLFNKSSPISILQVKIGRREDDLIWHCHTTNAF